MNVRWNALLDGTDEECVMSKEVDDLKQEATRLLEGMFRIPEGYSSGTLRRVVDCIVFAAAIQVAEWQRDAIKAVPPND